MSPSTLLLIFVALKLAQHIAEMSLAHANRRYCDDPNQLARASSILGIAAADMAKTQSYSRDRYRFGVISSWIQITVSLLFIAFGGLGYLESFVTIEGQSTLIRGLLFFGALGLLSGIFGLPFDYYQTFVIEQRHGFNRQTLGGFFLDKARMLALSGLLGGVLLAAILFIIERAGEQWWVLAWVAMTGFSLLTAWLYPTFLAPLFNKFKPLDDGELKRKIFALAETVAFSADSISIMDASRRTAHGNAYFTGVFGKKKIVLFDTLVNSMAVSEVVAVLAHELGHFKLHHVRWSLIRGFALTGMMFYLMHLSFGLETFYQALGLHGISPYGALIVFSLWFGPLSFLIQPFSNAISRSNEFAADSFALKHVEDPRLLGDALLKLRETSHAMPISHPLYSRVYHSHPPLLERLQAMGYVGVQYGKDHGTAAQSL